MSRRFPTAPAAEDLVIRCDDLSAARGGVRVAEGVSIHLPPRRALAIMGPTGAGKSSLVALLAGDDSAGVTLAGGAATVLGVPVNRRGRARRVRAYRTGYLAQGAGTDLPPRLTVEEVIGDPVTSRDRRLGGRALSLRIVGLLDELELPLGAAAKYPYELSSGMRQRVALARALVLQPALFVGDEPYANLDLEVRRAAREALLRRRDELGMAIILVTNDAAAARELDADVLVLRSGHPVGFGRSADELVWTPGERLRQAS